MPKLTTSDDQIRAVIPNISVTAGTEPKWLQRLTPFLDRAEAYHSKFIAPLPDPDSPEAEDSRNFTILRAWNHAIPMLDLTVTTNGFAIVSNNNLAPASRERVAEARSAAIRAADEIAFRILDRLRLDPNWTNSHHASIYRSLIPNPWTWAHAFMFTEYQLDKYLAEIPKIRIAENRLATRTISQPVLQYWRELAWTGETVNQDMQFRIILDLYRNTTIHIARENITLQQGLLQLDAVIEYLKNNPQTQSAQIWADTPIGKAILNPDTYENTKDSAGFIF